MHVVYLHQYFATPAMPEGTRSYEMARRLVAAGHRVSMVTSFRQPTDKTDWWVTDEAGIEVHWLPVPYSNRMSFWQRISSFMRFALGSARRARDLGGDVVFATSTPLTIAIPGIYASRRNRLPMVFELRDMWPDVPIAMGILRNPLLIRVARWLEMAAYRHAHRIVALAPGMRDDVVSRGVPARKFEVIPNGCDNGIFGVPADPARSPRRMHAWLGERKLVIYPGAIGPVNGVPYLVDLAKHMRGIDPEIRFVIIGAGRDADMVRERAREAGVLGNNLHMLPSMAKAELADWMAAANMLICLIGPKSVSKDAVQNKFFDAMAAGKPTVCNFEGFQTRIAREHDIGITLDPNDVAAAASALARTLHDEAWLSAASDRCQKLANGAFSRDHLAERLRGVLESCAAPSGSPRPGSIHAQVAALHMEAIGQGFLSSLGEEFLALVYRAIDEDPHSALFVEEHAGRVTGFVAGTTNARSMYRRLFRRLPAVLWSLRGSLVSPRRLAGMLSVVRYVRGSGPKLPDLPSAELLSIAVSPDQRGKGVSERLYRRLESHFAAQGVQRFKIIAGEALIPARRFYERVGARLVARFNMHAGAESLIFVHDCGKGVPA
jgi:glycosyltransferase involved in cell wall biosynthesis/ribosomal protein S18 acetylase RimI-like enzyme